METEKQNLDFQANLERDNKECVLKREFMNHLIIDTE